VDSDVVLARIGRKYDASAAQVALKWLLDQDGVAAIPKASRAASQNANLDALKLRLDDDDRSAIAALPKNLRCVNPGFAPTWDCPVILGGTSRFPRHPRSRACAQRATLTSEL